MDKVNQKMRKFNLRGVLIGLRATALGNSPHKLDSTGIEETLRSEHFQVAKVRITHKHTRTHATAQEQLQCLAVKGELTERLVSSRDSLGPRDLSLYHRLSNGFLSPSPPSTPSPRPHNTSVISRLRSCTHLPRSILWTKKLSIIVKFVLNKYRWPLYKLS